MTEPTPVTSHLPTATLCAQPSLFTKNIVFFKPMYFGLLLLALTRIETPRTISSHREVSRETLLSVSQHNYFPMQKLLKISPSKSSAVYSPVIADNACCARRNSSASKSNCDNSSANNTAFRKLTFA